MTQRRLDETRLKASKDDAEARWIEQELTGDTGSVASVVPGCFDAYVRVFHPATAPNGSPVRWSEAAVALGREMHALAQWHALVGSADPDDLSDSEWMGGDPERGDMWPEVLAPLCVLLGEHTKTAEHVFFGLWTGWTSVVFRAYPKGSGQSGGMEPVQSVGDIPGPRFELPPQAGREYLLLSGPLSAASEVADSEGTINLAPGSPNLIWPADRSWFLATEIDFDSTIVGGKEALIESIVDAEEIEAWQVGPNDSLAWDADQTNSAKRS